MFSFARARHSPALYDTSATPIVSFTARPSDRRIKDVAQEQYTQAEAERGAGMSKEKYPPAHPISGTAAPVVSVEKLGAANALQNVEATSSMQVAGDANDDDPDL